MTIPSKVLEATEKRFIARTEKREEVAKKLESGSVLQANDPQLVQKRLERLTRSAVSETAAETGAVKGTVMRGVPGIEPATLERIIGNNELININYLELGIRVARSVGRIRIRSATKQTLGFGTGFMVSPRLLVTNNHVLTGFEDAANSQVEFNIQDDASGKALIPVVFDFDPGTFFLTNEDLDFTLIAVKDRAQDSTTENPLSSFGWIRLIEDDGKIILGEAVSIIQHPNGEPKQLALRENKLVDLLDEFLHYETDTAPGSSGSPVFNDQWEAVSLHHSGVPRRDEAGRILTRDGIVWKPEMGEHRIDWIANEGVRVSKIIGHIKSQPFDSGKRILIDEMLGADLLPAPPIVETRPQSTVPDRQQHAYDSAAVAGERDVTWTIPIQVSIRLGQPTLVQTSATYSIQPATRVDALPSPQVSDSAELRAAITELRTARAKPYYDESQDARDRDKYYQGLQESLSPSELFKALHNLLDQTHINKPRYQPAEHVYTWVDLQPDLKLKSVYSGLQYEPEEIIREDFRIDEARESRIREKFHEGVSGRGAPG